MSFYPDGQPRIPNQIPVPGARPVPSADDAARARSRALVRMALINGCVLVVAVLVGIVLELPSAETGIWVVVGAALLTGAHAVVVTMRLAQGRAAVAPSPVDAVPDAVTDETVVGSSFTLQIEDVFTITGRGTVVTGRVARGEVRTGETVALLREGHLLAHVRVDGIEAFREQRTTASAGDLVGLVLSGVTRADLARGDVVTAAGGSAQDGRFSAASS